MSICCHQVDTLNRLCINLDTCLVTPTFRSILKNECLCTLTESLREERTIVYTIEVLKTIRRNHAPVCHSRLVYGLVEDEFTGNRKRERCRQLIINCQRCLPTLWQLEVWIYCRNRRRNCTICWANSHRIT